MKTECYLCGRKFETTDLIATLNSNLEGVDKHCWNIITSLKQENICSWCASRFDYWQKKIREIIKLEKQRKE